MASLREKETILKKIFFLPTIQHNCGAQNVSMTHNFEDMEIWQEARILVREVRAICKHPRVCKDFVFIDQITRAARSVMYNVAEGAEAQTNPEFIQFLGYAKRSAGEVRAQLYDALDQQYVDQPTFEKIKIRTERIGRMIGGFIRYLSIHSGSAIRNPQSAFKREGVRG